MDQRLSRPVRWRGAASRGINAARDLLNLRSEWRMRLRELLEELDRLRDQQSNKDRELEEALGELICLQSEYDNMDTPENLENSRFHEKRLDVQNFNFEILLKEAGDTTKFPIEDELREAIDAFDDPGSDTFDDPYNEVIETLDEARQFDLPKGYGRD